jgi:restriction endonuclease S subunit
MDDLCLGITSGSTPPNHIFSDTEGIPFLKVYNIRNQKVDFQYKSQFISEEYHLKSKRSCLKEGDVIMNIVGPPLGKVAIIPDEFPEYNCNQAIVFFRPIIKSLNKYLYLYLLSGKFLDKIDLIGTAGQDNISVTKSRTIPIPLPPLAEQHRIVAKIDQLMTLCDKLEKQIDIANSKKTNLLNSVMTKI